MQTIEHGRARIGSEDLLAGTISVVSTFLRRSSVPTEGLNQMIRNVNLAMLEVATDSAAVVSNLQGVDFQKVLEAASARFGVLPVQLETDDPSATFSPAEPVSVQAPVAQPVPPASVHSAEASSQPPLSGRRNRSVEEVPPSHQIEMNLTSVASPALQSSEKAADVAPPKSDRRAAVDIKKSVRMNALICLEDGERVIDLSAHLFEKFDMTPDQYRAKWGLPETYPMLAPASTLKRGDQFEIDPVTKAFIPLRSQVKPGMMPVPEVASASTDDTPPE